MHQVKCTAAARKLPFPGKHFVLFAVYSTWITDFHLAQKAPWSRVLDSHSYHTIRTNASISLYSLAYGAPNPIIIFFIILLAVKTFLVFHVNSSIFCKISKNLKTCNTLVHCPVCWKLLGPSLVGDVSWGSNFCTERGWESTGERKGSSWIPN